MSRPFARRSRLGRHLGPGRMAYGGSKRRQPIPEPAEANPAVFVCCRQVGMTLSCIIDNPVGGVPLLMARGTATGRFG